MKLGIMQPYFFPYIGYWQLLNIVECYILYDDVNFIKGGWINRNQILSNGDAQYFNVSMQNSSSNRLINEIGVSENQILKKKMITTLQTCYAKAPYYNDIIPMLSNIIMNETTNLSKYIEYSIHSICKFLNINTELICSSTIAKNNDLRGQDKILDICRIYGADEYYNAIGGIDLYNKDIFDEQGVSLHFVKTNSIEYKQYNNNFIPNLSIIDVMMFNSPEEIHQMLDNYTLT